MVNSVKPPSIVEAAINAGSVKAKMPWLDMILRGIFSGFFLGGSSSLAATVQTQTGLAMIGGLLFPCGFLMIIIYGLELVTGNMLLVPMAFMARRCSFWGVTRNLVTVWCCNLVGTSLYLALFYGGLTLFGEIPDGGAVGKTIIAIGEGKTIKYVAAGGAGWAACFVKAILCNFLVSFAALGSLCTTSTVGKVVACWLPVIMFAILGYEHVVVNMFVIPMAMALGANVTWGNWWLWNLLPATLGNGFAAMVMVALPMWVTWGHDYRKEQKLAAAIDEKEKDFSLDNTSPLICAEDFEAFQPVLAPTPNDHTDAQHSPMQVV